MRLVSEIQPFLTYMLLERYTNEPFQQESCFLKTDGFQFHQRSVALTESQTSYEFLFPK